MGLSSALFTGTSGIDVNQQWLNTIGNNIANANTTAFKSTRTLFSPQFYVTDASGAAPSTNFGGTNPSQEGQGVVVADNEKDFTPGSIKVTGQSTDMAIDGSGFFVVKGNQQLYTRDGAFTLNSTDQLVTGSGQFVQGYGVDAQGNVLTGALQNVTIPLGASSIAKASGNAAMEGNLNASGTVATGASVLIGQDLTTVGGTTAPTGATLLTAVASPSSSATPMFTAGETLSLSGTKGGRTLPTATYTVTGTSTVQDLMTFFQQSMGIDTSVTATPPPGVTLESGTAPGTAHFAVVGNTGTENKLEITGSGFTGTGGTTPFTLTDGTNAAGYTSNPNGESVHTSFQVYDSLGNPLNVDVTAVLESKSNTGNTWRFYTDSSANVGGAYALGNGTLTFDSSGNLISSTGASFSISRAGTGAMTPLSVNLDFSKMTQLSGAQSSLVMSTQDGFPAGTLQSFSVGTDGTISGAYSNGLTRTIGRVAIATFSNEKGLVDQGGNMFAAGASSGAAQISSPGQLGAGVIRGASLEQSNVDLSTEFVNMIVASTGFNASSRVITTSNQMIQELLNTAR